MDPLEGHGPARRGATQERDARGLRGDEGAGNDTSTRGHEDGAGNALEQAPGLTVSRIEQARGHQG